MSKKEGSFRKYEKLLKQKKPDKKPVTCKQCPYYQPEFRFRSCLYARCQFNKEATIFRERPLKKDPFHTKGGVETNE